MGDPIDIKELFDKRYGDRGGYKVLDQIFGSQHLGYEDKLIEAQKRFRLSRSRLVIIYGRYRAREGLK